MNDKLNRMLQNSLVYAARYAHGRNTGAALQVCMAIVYYWDQLDGDVQNNLYRESFEAEHNTVEWETLRNDVKAKGYVPAEGN
jgi:hypothetical protein